MQPRAGEDLGAAARLRARVAIGVLLGGSGEALLAATGTMPGPPPPWYRELEQPDRERRARTLAALLLEVARALDARGWR